MCCRNKEKNPGTPSALAGGASGKNLEDDVWTNAIPSHIADSLRSASNGQRVKDVTLNDNLAATVLSDAFCEVAFIRNAHVETRVLDEQVYYRSYQRSADGLAELGMSFSDVVRTWIYLKNMDHTYAPFNAQRDRFYVDNEVFSRRVPASTAIGKPQNTGAEMVLHILAVKPLRQDVVIQPVPSPLQCSAMNYKVSFSRAMEIQTPAYRRLLISGTASIDSQGKTVFEKDLSRQADRTVEVIEALLHSRGMTTSSLTRVLGYTKKDDNLAYGDRYIKKWVPATGHSLHVQGDVCRGNLLFEIEADALLRL